ncbi:MAG: CRISPR-associated protein Cas5 [Capsulimonadaceae bacterium]|nr:CRISPR-associated protein Cas5 [Capsulimonadaceae bacterium]
MNGIIIRVSGRWAQFRKPETNNTPLTHDFITKTAMIGLVGAVLGVERGPMRALFPQLCEDLLYGVLIRGVVKKQSWAFTLRNAHKPNDPAEKAPRQMEFIRDPDYYVALALRGERSSGVFQQFADAVQNCKACFTPVLGLHNCPAELEWLHTGEFLARQETYQTKGFALRTHTLVGKIEPRLRVGFERIPTYQDDNWWNRPDGYREVVYPSAGTELQVSGEHFVFSTGEAWCLI